MLAVAAMDRMNELSFPNATVTATGAPILLDDINNYLRGGMLMLGGIAVAIMTLILLVLFDVRWRLLPLAVILVGVVWAFGLAGYLGIPLTIVTIAGLPVMLGVGIDYAIQLHARVEEEVILDRSDHPIQETARNLGPALLVVTFDAVFAFLALRFAKVPMIRDFGLLLAVGIAVICLNSIVMPLAVLGIREYRSPTKGRDFRRGRSAGSPSGSGRCRSRSRAPGGSAPPVMMRAAAPGSTVGSRPVPANTSPVIRRGTGVASPAPARSAPRTAKPSMAELANGGRSSAAATSAARTQPRASASPSLPDRERGPAAPARPPSPRRTAPGRAGSAGRAGRRLSWGDASASPAPAPPPGGPGRPRTGAGSPRRPGRCRRGGRPARPWPAGSRSCRRRRSGSR